MAVSENFEIGTTSVTTNVESLGTPLYPPRSTYLEYSAPQPLANGTVRGGGWVEATWTWDWITQAMRTQLKTFCSGKSATIYIRTKDNTGSFVYKTGTMIWPDSEERTTTHILNFVLRFVALETFVP